jgi:hypothetical protein
MQSLDTTSDFFAFVPGNHDVDRTQISKPFELGLAQSIIDQRSFRDFYNLAKKNHPDADLLRRKFSGYYDFIKSHSQKHVTYNSLFYDTCEYLVSGIKVGIVGLNSAWRSSQHGPDANRLVIGDHVILEAASKIEGCDIRICLCHHPLEMLVDWDKKPVRQAIAKNFNVLLNGHVHDSDAIFAQQLLGSLFVSTAGCLKPHEQFSSYSLIQLDLDRDSIICHFRKWYPERGEFDQETSKAPEGKFLINGIKNGTPKLTEALNVASVRNKLHVDRAEPDVVCPIDGLDDIELQDVFVQPLLTNKSGFDRDTDDRKTHNLEELLKSEKNLLIAGRPEFGKSTIIKYARDFILKHDKFFDSKIPVLVNFKDISNPNVRLFARQVGRLLNQSGEELLKFAARGQLTFLIDDFGDKQDEGYEKKLKMLREFHMSYPQCRFILSVTEHLAPQLQFELSTLASDFKAELVYIGSLNTARIRQLLNKWKLQQDFDVDSMLSQILHYFQHCQIPVTPLSVVLFLGVLFNRKRERSIKNEAFLIENYLERILEKLNPGKSDSEPDFRDKEDFLASFAWELVQRRKTSIDSNDFEKFKIEFFDKRDEDVPRQSFFDKFFSKGILRNEDGQVCFKRRFWFHFFIAKALDTHKDAQATLLERDDVLKYSKALAYKAGLSRKDVDLLKWVDERAMADLKPMVDMFKEHELNQVDLSEKVEELSEAITKELREKNTDDKVDEHRDNIYLKYDEDKGYQDETNIEQFDDLLTLESDIIRNTTQIGVQDKRKYIENNVTCYVALMWAGLQTFRDILQKSDEAQLFDLFFKGRKDASMEHKLRVVIEHAQRVVHFVVPLSVLVYMNEHLGNPKLTKSFRMLAESTTSPTKRLFYYLLLFAQDNKEGIKFLSKQVSAESAMTEDFIICGFLRWYCYQTRVEESVLTKIVSIFEHTRKKCSKRQHKDVPYMRDTFKSDVRKDLVSKHITPAKQDDAG